MTKRIIMGRIGAAQGIHGWLKITSYTTPPSNILSYATWQLQRGQQWLTISPDNNKIQGDTLLAKLPECNSREDAKTWTNTIIAINRDELPLLASDEFYWSDLIGCRLINNTGTDYGLVARILETGANDVFVVEGERRRLIPYIDDVILSIDQENKLITVNWDPDF